MLLLQENPLDEVIVRSLYGGVLERNLLNLSDPEVRNISSHVDMEELAHRAAHQFEDMFLSCRWQGQRLSNCSQYFRRILTHNGHCYTFNAYDWIKINDVMTTGKTGVHNGLTLELNVEQYEYSRGPHRAAGLIVSLMLLSQ